MSWRDKHRDYVRPTRPKARKCTKAECSEILDTFLAAVQKSPVLVGLGCTINVARSRFYVGQIGPSGPIQWARITPLDESDDFILECAGRRSNMFEVARGRPGKLIDAIASDTRGTFHGLGSIDKQLRILKKEGTDLTELIRCVGKPNQPDFKNTSGERVSPQIALHCFFGIPFAILIEPREWYARHRTPCILEYSSDLTRVLVQFSAATLTSTIIGTCLYLKHSHQSAAPEDGELESDGYWGAYTIRPAESESISKAEAWIVKRKWNAW